ncbi:MAG TPA: hypothetical protein VFG08_08645 [Candidatus Polarisedimenticolia bacterium]|nr:hypothetical protein [Candidatus Polarisedimenticolia bacterium]
MMPNSPCRTASLAGLLILVLHVPAAPTAAREKQGDQDEPVKLGVKLRADPSVGFTPVVATLTGELTGVDPLDPNFCHPAVTWVRLDPGDSEETASKLRQDPVCRHAEEETLAQTYFTRQFSLERPGPYLFRLVIEGKDGTMVRSDYASVRVMRVQ